ncbi:methyl-accepting chemotaxis protein [Solidesulfovibrio sp.]
MRFSDLRIRTRLLIGFSAVIAIFSLMASLQIYNMIELGHLQDAGAKRAKDAQFVGQIDSRLEALYGTAADAVINGDLDKAAKDLALAKSQAKKDIDLMHQLADTPDEKIKVAEFERTYEKYFTVIETKMLPLLRAEGSSINKSVQTIDAELDGLKTSAIYTLDSVLESMTYESDEADRQFDAVKNKSTSIAILLSSTALIVGIVFGIIVSISITRPLSKGVRFATGVAGGHLDEQLDIHQKDEIGVLADALRTMVDNLKAKSYWYENILNAIPFPVSVTDNNMKWTFLNKAVENIAKVKSSEMLGKHCNNWGANICNTDECGIRCAEKGNGQGRSYFTQPQFPGKEFLVDCSFIYNNKNEKVGHIEVIQDITEANDAKRQAEQALKDGIAQAAQQLEAVVEIVTSASEQLSAQIEQSSHGSEEQAQSIAETATAMEEMNATVLEVAKNASNAAGTADQAKVKAEEGAKMVGQVIQGIEQVQNQSQTMKMDMGNLGQQAEGIGQILNVISDIADQTNLLALNAAIEAARAGDAGRGFAVVADEVRKLAEKTMTATKEVGNAIRGIQDGTKKNIENVERTGKNIEEVTHLATNSGEALKQIVTLSDKTTDQVRSIATASEQQSATSEEINRSIESVNRISSETADAMRQSAQAVTELANQAQVLKRLIDEMKSDGGSSATALTAGKKPFALGKG